MAIRGLSIPVFGKYTKNDTTGEISYTDGFICGHAVNYTVELETDNGNPFYGDNMIVEHDTAGFGNGTLTLTTSELDQTASKSILGLKEVTRTVGEGSSAVEYTELVFDDDRTSVPYGIGVIEKHQINDILKYKAVILTKCMPNIPQNAATTEGDTVEWQTPELTFTIERSEQVTATATVAGYNHPWKIESWHDTEAAAADYLKAVLGVAAG